MTKCARYYTEVEKTTVSLRNRISKYCNPEFRNRYKIFKLREKERERKKKDRKKERKKEKANKQKNEIEKKEKRKNKKH